MDLIERSAGSIEIMTSKSGLGHIRKKNTLHNTTNVSASLYREVVNLHFYLRTHYFSHT